VKLHLIHGIHATRKSATNQLAPYYRNQGFEVVVHNYGYALAMPRFFGDWLNDKRAEKIAKKIEDGDMVVGHSNGTTIFHIIQKKYRKISASVLFQPALDNDATFTGTDRVLVIYNDADDVVEQSRLAWFSSWGNMGRVGYKGEGKNVECWDAKNPPEVPPLPYSGHCGFVETGEAVKRSWGIATGEWLKRKNNG
jgi:hypothetical protein